MRNGERALICGVSGQDGAYLAKLLLDKGYEVCGTVRDVRASSSANLEKLGIVDSVKLESMAITDFRSVLQTLVKVRPHELYNLAAQSSVGLSFEQPVETFESISVGTVNLLEAIRFVDFSVKFYNAGSGESFGDVGDASADEDTPFRPRSPYAVAKAAAFWEVANYREAYGLFAVSGIAFNHESPLRSESFVTKKIIKAACRLASGEGGEETLRLGNLSVARDWGWASDYIEAMWMMLQQELPEDFVIATGETCSLKDFLATAFEAVGRNWREHVVEDRSLYRPNEILIGRANPTKAFEKLGWRAKYKMKDIVRMMIDHELLSSEQL